MKLRLHFVGSYGTRGERGPYTRAALFSAFHAEVPLPERGGGPGLAAADGGGLERAQLRAAADLAVSALQLIALRNNRDFQ